MKRSRFTEEQIVGILQAAKRRAKRLKELAIERRRFGYRRPMTLSGLQADN